MRHTSHLLSHLRVQVGTGVTNVPFLEYQNGLYDSVQQLAAAAQDGQNGPAARWNGCVLRGIGVERHTENRSSF